MGYGKRDKGKSDETVSGDFVTEAVHGDRAIAGAPVVGDLQVENAVEGFAARTGAANRKAGASA